MDPVVTNGIDRNHVSIVLECLRKAGGDLRELAHVHSHGKILTLGIARADVLRIVLSGAAGRLGSDDHRGAIEALTFRHWSDCFEKSSLGKHSCAVVVI